MRSARCLASSETRLRVLIWATESRDKPIKEIAAWSVIFDYLPVLVYLQALVVSKSMLHVSAHFNLFEFSRSFDQAIGLNFYAVHMYE